ncbi:MAG: M28 family peptidase [Thermoplasmata archaeon]|nr:M28 family peptidase [Thermoplasmata archaeon]
MNDFQDEDPRTDDWSMDDGGEMSHFSRMKTFGNKNPRLTILLAVVLVVIIVGAGFYYVVLRNEEDFDPTIIEFDWQRAYADGQYLIRDGPRLAGTEEEYRAAEYIAREFIAAGLSNVRIENYTVGLYEVDHASLNLQALSLELGYIYKDYRHLYEFAVMGYSGSTNDEEGFDIVFVGNGTDEAYAEAGDVSGKAVLVRTDRTLSYTQLYIQAMNHSAGASIIYGDRARSISRTSALPDEENGGLKPITDEYPNDQLIPHMMVSPEVGEEIKSWNENSTGLTEHCQLNIDFDVSIEDRITKVVIGEIIGKEKPKDFVVMGAHHDTVYTGEGGADNTVGTCCIIETARQLAHYKPKRTIKMMTFGAEEEGLLGSKAYVLNHSEEIEKHCIFMTNFDMTCLNVTEDGKNNTFPVNANSERRRKEIEKVGKEFFKQNPELDEKYNFSAGIMENYPYSDFFHFGYHGSDFAAGWGQNSPGYHTPGDKLEYTNPESWQIAGRIMGSYTLWLADE